jgi:hypothetical protein
MKPGDYVEEIVLPTMRDFGSNPRSRRHAYLTCMAVFHIRDHLKVALKVSKADIDRKMQAATTATSNSFDVVRAICNGTKHAGPDHYNPIKFRPGDDFDRPAARAGEMQAGISRFGDPAGGREIGHDPKARADIYTACRTTLAAFCSVFPHHLGNCDLSGL